jgi:hypothetical protein
MNKGNQKVLHVLNGSENRISRVSGDSLLDSFSARTINLSFKCINISCIHYIVHGLSIMQRTICTTDILKRSWEKGIDLLHCCQLI